MSCNSDPQGWFQDALFASFTLPTAGEPAFRQASFALTASQHETVTAAIRAALRAHPAPEGNRNAHALAVIATAYTATDPLGSVDPSAARSTMVERDG